MAVVDAGYTASTSISFSSVVGAMVGVCKTLYSEVFVTWGGEGN